MLSVWRERSNLKKLNKKQSDVFYGMHDNKMDRFGNLNLKKKNKKKTKIWHQNPLNHQQLESNISSWQFVKNDILVFTRKLIVRLEYHKKPQTSS